MFTVLSSYEPPLFSDILNQTVPLRPKSLCNANPKASKHRDKPLTSGLPSNTPFSNSRDWTGCSNGEIEAKVGKPFQMQINMLAVASISC